MTPHISPPQGTVSPPSHTPSLVHLRKLSNRTIMGDKENDLQLPRIFNKKMQPQHEGEDLLKSAKFDKGYVWRKQSHTILN